MGNPLQVIPWTRAELDKIEHDFEQAMAALVSEGGEVTRLTLEVAKAQQALEAAEYRRQEAQKQVRSCWRRMTRPEEFKEAPS